MPAITLPRADHRDDTLDIHTLASSARLLSWLADNGMRPHALPLDDRRLGVLFDDGRERGVWGLIEFTAGGLFLGASITDDGRDLRYDGEHPSARQLLMVRLASTVSGGTFPA